AVRAGSGRDGMKVAPMIAPSDGRGALPLLEPAHVQFSASYFLDLAKFWEDRATIFNKEQLAGLEMVDKETSKYLEATVGASLSKLLSQSGPHQRIVVVQQTKPGYTVKPKQQFPGFAVVQSLRDPALGKSLATLLRSAALAGSFKFDLRLIEEKHGPYQLVGYRFKEDKKLGFGAEYETIQFNFSPCFAIVDKQFIVSSTMELGRELIDIVSQDDANKAAAATTRLQAYSSGVADSLRNAEAQLLTQLILSQALAPKEAQSQLKTMIDLVDRLGVLNLDIQYGKRDARAD